MRQIKLEIPQEVIRDRGVSFKEVNGLTKDNQKSVDEFLMKLQNDGPPR